MKNKFEFVIPAKAGIQSWFVTALRAAWIPAFAGMTISAALLPSRAAAQDAPQNPPPEKVTTVPLDVRDAHDSTQLETIQVTASKHLKSQRDIPGSVGAIRGEELEKMHAQGLKDYLKLIPGVSFADQGTDASVPIIRGIATQIDLGFTAQTTGIYLDEMPFADLFAPLSLPDLNPFDLERVEVLKGPQGTLFGSGALAGAVRYITQKPKYGVWETKFEETVSKTHLGGGLSPVTAGAINIPLGDTFSIRVVGVYRKDRGLYDKSAEQCVPSITPPASGLPLPSPTPLVCTGNKLRDDPDADKLTQKTGRVLAAWSPTERLKLSAFYFIQKTHLDDTPTAGNPQTPDRDDAPFASPRDHEFGGGNLLVTYDFDWARLLSSTNRLTKHNYILDHAEWFFGLEHQDQNEFYNLTINDVHGFTQELRVSSPEGASGNWEWTAGASYLRYKDFLFQYEAEPGPGMPPPSGPGELSTAQRATSFIFATIDSEASEAALFGDVTRRFGEHWEVAAGARVYRTRLIADTALSGAQIVAFAQKPEDDEHFEPREHGFNPRFSVRYLLNRNVQAYALASKGFQFGGVQLNPPTQLFMQSAEQSGFHFGPYKSSVLWNYETGLRTEWLHHRLRFDVGLFYLDWKDLQLTVQVPLGGASALNANIGVVANVGRAHSDGAEAALDVVLFSGARWTSSAAFINAVTDVSFDGANPAGPVPAGTRLPGTPRFQWSNVLSYEHNLPYFNNWSGGATLTHVHTGSSPDAIRPTGSVGGYNTLDARIDLTRTGSRFVPQLSLGVNNLTDVRGVTYHLRSTSPVTMNPIDFYHFVQPRTALASLNLRF